MKTKEDMLKEEIFAKMKKDGTSSVLVNKLKGVMDQFATVDAFFRAQKADILKAYNKLTPGKNYGLGVAFFAAYDRAHAIFLEDGKIEAKPEQVYVPRKDDDVDLEKFYSLEELKSIVALMELSYIESVKLGELVSLIRSIKIRQAARKAQEMKENPEAGNAEVKDAVEGKDNG